MAVTINEGKASINRKTLVGVAGLLALQILAWVVFSGPATAAMAAPGFEPRDWPANPAKHQVKVRHISGDGPTEVPILCHARMVPPHGGVRSSSPIPSLSLS